MASGFIFPENTSEYLVKSNLHYEGTRQALSSLLKVTKKNRELSIGMHSYYCNRNHYK